ncbi:MAG: hypothetical protein R3345_08240 [Fulvivirga sp.]|nr:hypothetical protein [Fulvivirga sp.]
MPKIICTLSLFVFFQLGAQDLQKTKIGEDITVMLPESFFPMSNSDLAQRYPSVRKPIGAFTTSSRMVDFSVKISATRWRDTDKEIARDFFKASLINMYDRIEFLKEEIKTINKKDFIVFEFESRIHGDEHLDPVRKYVYIQYLLINGKTIVFTFNCPIQMKEEWQKTVEEIMESVKVKNSI